MNDSFIIFNQLAQNRRLRRIENALRSQGHDGSEQAVRKNLIDQKREVVFTVKRELENVEKSSALSDFDQALTLEMLKTYVEVNQISPRFFPEILDKEYTSRSLEMLREMRAEALSKLSPLEQSGVAEESKRRFVIRHMERLSCLLRMKEALPRIPFYRRVTGRGAVFWIVLLLFIQPLLAVPLLFWEEFDLQKAQWVSNGLFAMTALIGIREIWFRMRRKTKSPHLQSLAAKVGLNTGSDLTLESLMMQLNDERSLLAYHGQKVLLENYRAAEEYLSELKHQSKGE